MTTVTASVDERVLQGIDALELSAESKRLRAAYFDTSTRIATERPRIAMRAWQESEGLPVATRRAHLFERVLAEVPVAIHPDELTVGSETRWFRGVYPTVDHDPELLLRQLAKGALNLQSIVHHGQITKEDWDGVVETARYFSGKTGPDLIREVQKKALGTWWGDFIEVSGTTPFESGFIVAGVPLYEKVLARGLSGIVGEAEEKLARFADLREDDPEKLLFWQGSIAACKAAIAFAERYADVAEQMAAREQDKQRKGQLQRVAQACRWVPANPARSFFEAVQSVRLVHLACKLVSVESGIGWLGYFRERAENVYRRHRFSLKSSLKHPPGDYFGRNIFATFEEERSGILTKDLIGVDALLWASDYPHTDTTWPKSRDVIEKYLVGVPEDEVRKLVHLNTARVYGLN